MKDVRLSVYGSSETFHSEIFSMEELPRLSEYISTTYFQQKFNEMKDQKEFKVSKILHHYTDDMCRIDYTEIILEATTK